VGVGIAALGDLSSTRGRLLQKGVKFHPDTAVESIEGTIVSAKNVFTNAPVTFREYDTIIVAAGFSADEALYFDLKGKVTELYRAGDCVAPRGIEMAIYEGEKVGGLL
jgi:NADH dehydrogenase FAD-containing subunit